MSYVVLSLSLISVSISFRYKLLWSYRSRLKFFKTEYLHCILYCITVQLLKCFLAIRGKFSASSSTPMTESSSSKTLLAIYHTTCYLPPCILHWRVGSSVLLRNTVEQLPENTVFLFPTVGSNSLIQTLVSTYQTTWYFLPTGEKAAFSSKTLVTTNHGNFYPEDVHNNSFRNVGSQQTHNRASCTPKIRGQHFFSDIHVTTYMISETRSKLFLS